MGGGKGHAGCLENKALKVSPAPPGRKAALAPKAKPGQPVHKASPAHKAHPVRMALPRILEKTAIGGSVKLILALMPAAG